MSDSKTYPIPLCDGAIIRTIGMDEFPRVLGIMNQAFPDVSSDFFESITLKDPWYHPKFSLVVEKEGELLTHVQIFDRMLWIQGEPYRIGGIGSVGTAKEAQGRGYASSLMKHAISIMQAEQMQGGLLFTGIHPFYEKLGWRTLVQLECDVLVHCLPRISYRDEFRYIDHTDYPVLQAFYGSLQAQVSGLVVRDLNYWEERPNWLKHLPVIALLNDKIIGYFYATQYRKKENVLNISEFGLADDSPEVIEALLSVMGRKATEFGCNTIRAFFLQHPAMKQYLINKNLVEQEKEFRYMMWYDLDHSFDQIQALANQHGFLYWQSDGI